MITAHLTATGHSPDEAREALIKETLAIVAWKDITVLQTNPDTWTATAEVYDAGRFFLAYCNEAIRERVVD